MASTVYYSVKRPFSPLPSDRTTLWLASTYAAAGHKVSPAARPGLAGGDCGLLLTNRKLSNQETGFPVIRIGCGSDRRDRLRQSLGVLYGRTPLYQSDNVAGRLLAGALSPLRRLLGVRRRPAIPDGSAPDGTPPDLTDRRVVLRINVDWDARGLDILERWCETFELRPTLAVAGIEVKDNESRLRSFIKGTGCDIASHTWSHCVVLSSHGAKRQREEIAANHDYLSQLTGKAVKGFVAPYVKYNRRTFDVLDELGYDWFIRNWLLHPLRLQGTGLTDLGVNFNFSSGWQDRLLVRPVHSDLVLQLHLRDLVSYEHLLEHSIRLLLQRGVRIIDCETFYRETAGGGS